MQSNCGEATTATKVAADAAAVVAVPPPPSHKQQQREEALQLFSGAEHYVVGISPTYWSHVPLCVYQIHNNLKLIDGINCLLVPVVTTTDATATATTKDNSNVATGGSSNKTSITKFVPITKCTLVGIVVAFERRSNGCIVYVIDDGTGLIDCLSWDNVTGDDNIDDDNSSSTLPPLVVPTTTASDNNNDRIIRVGELVRVYGRIENCCLLPPTAAVVETVHITTAADGTTNRDYQCLNCVREIHAGIVQRIMSTSSTSKSSSDLMMMNVESRHWGKCYHDATTSLLCNANDVLKRLGPKFETQVVQRTDLPFVIDNDHNNDDNDDQIGMWRLFGSNCNCKMIYKDALLYCHCHATIEQLDPLFRYRDCLLEKLVQMEQQQQQLPERRELRFQYSSVANDETLRQTATNVISSLSSESGGGGGGGNTKANIQRLVLNTFAALRQDGILYILDVNTDTYLFISCERVLEPYIRQQQQSTSSSVPPNTTTTGQPLKATTTIRRQRPSYLSKVPKVRLDIVRRRMLLNK